MGNRRPYGYRWMTCSQWHGSSLPAASWSGLARCPRRHEPSTRPIVDKNAPIMHKAFKDYAPSIVHAGIEYLPPMADETARRCPFAAIDHTKRRAYLRTYADRGGVSNTGFLRRLHAVASMRIEKLPTDKGSLFNDRISDIPTTTRFHLREDLQTTIAHTRSSTTSIFRS